VALRRGADGAPGVRVGAGGRRAIATRMPSATSVDTSDDPPTDTSGRVTPVMGSRPVTVPMLMSAWPTIQAVMPKATVRPKPSSAA
jgi:hypothetical protein